MNLLALLTVLLAAEPMSPVTGIAVVPDGKAILVASQNGIQELSWPERKPLRTWPTPFSHVHDLVFAPGGKQLALCGGQPGESGEVEVWNWPAGKTIKQLGLGEDVIQAVAWSRNERTIGLASADKSLVLYTLETNTTRTIHDHSGSVLAALFVAISKEKALAGELLLSAGRDGTIRVYDAATTKSVRTLDNHTAAVNALALRPGHDGELPMVASGGEDRTVRFWQPSIGRLVRFVRLPAPVLTVQWLPDGSQLVAVGTDGWLRVIDPQTAEIVLEKRVATGWLYSLAIAPEGTAAIVGDDVGELHFVPLEGMKRK